MAEVLNRIGLAAGEALAAGEVVPEPAILGMSLDQLASAIGRIGILSGLVQRPERGPELPACWLVCLAGNATDRDDRRPGLFDDSRSLHTGADEDERASRRVLPLAVQLEDGAPF